MSNSGCSECNGQLVANGSKMICMDCGEVQDSSSEVAHG